MSIKELYCVAMAVFKGWWVKGGQVVVRGSGWELFNRMHFMCGFLLVVRNHLSLP